ncbi:cytochrome P450 [Streptomyces griseus]|uniref:cytochrome P450 n=1 Tax=Streptomyces griseus TaxID=1911 RepID=UPI0037BAFCD2
MGVRVPERVVGDDLAVVLDDERRLHRTGCECGERPGLLGHGTSLEDPPGRLPGAPGVRVLRTLAEATALRGDLLGASRVVVVGNGVLGSEIAATVRRTGPAVTLVGPQPAPMADQIGSGVALHLAALHRRHGIELRGVPYADHAFFQANSKTLVSAVATAEERGLAHRTLVDYLHRLVGEKLDSPGDDLLSALAERIRAGELTRAGAAAMGVLLLLGGHETTANMISLGTLTLLDHPDQLARVRDTDDPAVVTAAVEELLRYLSIVHLGRRRTALEDIEIGGRTIRAGDGVILLGELANRDSAAFPDPDRLDITRNARLHQAFGAGAHHCVGQPLARMELQVICPTLFRRIPTLRAAEAVDRLPFTYDAVVHGLHALPVTW